MVKERLVVVVVLVVVGGVGCGSGGSERRCWR